MKSIGQKLILISLIFAVIAAGLVFAYLQSLKQSGEEINEITILVADNTIPAGTLITEKMIKEVHVPENSILVDYIRDYSDIVGKYTKETILKNEGFHKSKLISKGEGGLNLKIDNGYRAISINVTGDSGVSDLIEPGDFVDIIVYLAEKKDGEEVVRPDLSKIILQNVELLAIDKQLNRDDDSNYKEDIPNYFLVTLSVSTSELEKLVLAENIGILKLALRPLRDDSILETKGTTWKELVGWSGNTGGPLQGDKQNDSSNSNGEFVNYKVKPGDTLRKISMEFYGDPEKYVVIKKANNIQDANLIIPGEIIKIPVLNN
ncbi:MAG: Flp pilus assembly protein CpaB [Firmicutes bacterium]|nr:Flp pilus assembly protein CpaB [Bacillota bacterium]